MIVYILKNVKHVLMYSPMLGVLKLRSVLGPVAGQMHFGRKIGGRSGWLVKLICPEDCEESTLG